MAAQPLVQPNMYGEPLLAPNLRETRRRILIITEE